MRPTHVVHGHLEVRFCVAYTVSLCCVGLTEHTVDQLAEHALQAPASKLTHRVEGGVSSHGGQRSLHALVVVAYEEH